MQKTLNQIKNTENFKYDYSVMQELDINTYVLYNTLNCMKDSMTLNPKVDSKLENLLWELEKILFTYDTDDDLVGQLFSFTSFYDDKRTTKHSRRV